MDTVIGRLLRASPFLPNGWLGAAALKVAAFVQRLEWARGFATMLHRMELTQDIERGLAQWLGWRAAPAHRLARSWPSAWAQGWCRRCGATAAQGSTLVGCLRCHHKPMPWVAAARLGRWSQFIEPIVALKYRRRWDVGLHLGRKLAEVIRIEHGRLLSEAVAVVPVPMPRHRRMQRGVDHAAAIGIAVAKGLHLPLVQALGRRGGSTQAGQTRSLRLRARMPGLCLTRAGRQLPAGTVVLVDDVLTTGRTATTVCQALRCHCVVLAVVAVSDGDAC